MWEERASFSIFREYLRITPENLTCLTWSIILDKWHKTIGHMHCIKDLFKVWNKQYNVFSSLNTKNSCNEKQTYANFKNANNVLFIIYLYIFKSWSIAFIVTIFLLSHISSHIIHPFSTFFLILFFFSY